MPEQKHHLYETKENIPPREIPILTGPRKKKQSQPTQKPQENKT